MQSNNENEKLLLDGFKTQVFSQLPQQVRNFCDPVGKITQPSDNDIVHRYLDNAGVGFTFRWITGCWYGYNDSGWFTSTTLHWTG